MKSYSTKPAPVLQVLRRSGTPQEQKYAKTIEPVSQVRTSA